jgi:hypothetical protein
LTLDETDDQPFDWTPDSKAVIFISNRTEKPNIHRRPRRLWTGRRTAGTCPSTLWTAIRPDGHWLAYFSDETGQPEVYVVPFPGPGGKYQISHGGGWIVRWDKKGDLFFLSIGNQLMKAELNLSAQSLQVKSLRPLYQLNLADTPAPLFDVSADGQRLVAVTPARAESSAISLLLNWPALLHK